MSDEIETQISDDAALAPAPEATESSAAPVAETKGEESKETLLEAVQKVVNTTNEDGPEVKPADKEESPASEDDSDEEKDQAEDEKKTEADDQSEEEAPKDVSPKARKQINRLLRDRRELRTTVAQMQPAAEIGVELQNFTRQHDLASEDVINALHIAAVLRRGDYKTFYEMVSPYVRTAQEYLGVVLPDDLQNAVANRHMSPEAAREFARTRFDQQRMQIENQRMTEMGQTYFTNNVRSNVAQTVSDFEKRLATTDPDYAQKAGFVQRAAGAILRERGGSISSPQEAIDIVKAAYDEVNTHFRKIARNNQRATPPQPGVSNSQTSATRAQPRSMKEAVEQALLRSRAG